MEPMTEETRPIPAHFDHITVDELKKLIPDVLAGYAEKAGSPVHLEPMDRLKPLTDATTKFVIKSSKDQPLAAVICSQANAPQLVLRAMALAESISKIIGDELGRAIIKPVKSGYAGCCSYIVLPWCRRFSHRKLFRALQSLYFSRPILRWLQDANAMAAKVHGHSKETSLRFKEKLDHLAMQPFLEADIKKCIKKSISRLEAGEWTPRHSIDHNDLWLGNVMLTDRDDHNPNPGTPFVLIDWAGANPQGYGIYDLIRLSLTLKLFDKTLHHELVAHSKALQCSFEDVLGHFFAALGHLHQHLECFPENRYIQTFRNCWVALNRAISHKN